MKKIIRKFIYSVLRIIDLAFRKNKKRVIIFASTGVLDANLICVQQYLSKYYEDKLITVVLAKRKLSLLNYIRLAFTFFSGYYIFVDHAIPKFISGKNRKIINVWHGIPLKTIRALDSKRFTDRFLDSEARNLSGLVCSSELDLTIMSACFKVSPSKCILSGLPRADILLQKESDWFHDSQEEGLKDVLSGRKLVSWMPTYRGTWHEKNLITAFDSSDEIRLCDILKKNNALFGIRPHKFSRIQEFPLLEKEGLLVDLSKFDITNTVLKHTTHLITDYSSVWLDFSLISNKVSLYLFDHNEYDVDRGMIYPLEEVFKGQISFNSDDLFSDIEKSINRNDSDFSPSRLFFKYNDDKNTERLIKAIFDEE